MVPVLLGRRAGKNSSATSNAARSPSAPAGDHSRLPASTNTPRQGRCSARTPNSTPGWPRSATTSPRGSERPNAKDGSARSRGSKSASPEQIRNSPSRPPTPGGQRAVVDLHIPTINHPQPTTQHTSGSIPKHTNKHLTRPENRYRPTCINKFREYGFTRMPFGRNLALRANMPGRSSRSGLGNAARIRSVPVFTSTARSRNTIFPLAGCSVPVVRIRVMGRIFEVFARAPALGLAAEILGFAHVAVEPDGIERRDGGQQRGLPFAHQITDGHFVSPESDG